ncbi:MAG: ribosomal protein S18 acetylase RimI-like enzyme [Polaribacter sp.]|jgi:ribosomal protein S18 acetylase RimI-like enzyme
MNLIKFNKLHLTEVMEWFPNEESISIWGGLNFRFPYSAQSFMIDLDLSNTESFVLINDLGSTLAFGQYYRRNERCHLSRLVVSPFERGNGVGKHLIAQLSLQGRNDLKVGSCSLFVMTYNKLAMKLYLSLDFRKTIYPSEIGNDMVYMVWTSDSN